MSFDGPSFSICSAFRGVFLRHRNHHALLSPLSKPLSRKRKPSLRTYPACSALPPKGSPCYNFRDIELKWQRIWETRGDFSTSGLEDLDLSKPKFYALDMFPYPSGTGLHVGHPEGYTATDIMARVRRKQGFNVLHPMGWDAFGLPAEQYALHTGAHPADTTAKNISRFREQLQMLGFSYDWSRQVTTSDPRYYKWTQWIFLRLWERGLAYQDYVPVNWCPALGTVLANEEVIDGLSERGGHPVERRPMLQWVLRITEYADRLLDDLDGLDWPESLKNMQRNWIGRSAGVEIDFPVVVPEGDDNYIISAFTTRAETICGVSYLVIAPEWSGVLDITTKDRRGEVVEYIRTAAGKSDRERTSDFTTREKSGVFTGTHAVNPITGDKIPVWVADYVIGSYGSGAVMAVPVHDERDREFSSAQGIPATPAMFNGRNDVQFVAGDVIINWPSSTGIELNGVHITKARECIADRLSSAGRGRPKVNYKLRDWLFSRQRYWGEPFPIVFVDGKAQPVPDSDLPIVLPEVKSYQPSESGKSPLAKVSDWVETVDSSGARALRETNTMPQWAGSCWYYLRFIDPSNPGQPVDPKLEKYWMPVDLYIGGVEHAVLHLLYARFWHKVLYDIGVVSTKEPFQKLVNQGMILGEVEYIAYRDEEGEYVSTEEVDIASSTLSRTGKKVTEVSVDTGEVMKAGDYNVLTANRAVRVAGKAQKMSKSRGNVVNPDHIVECHGADSLRCYLMFMGPLEQVKPWRSEGVQGMSRFLSRTWRLVVDQESRKLSTTVTGEQATLEQQKHLHRMIKKVTTEINALRFNTAIASMMEFVNVATKWEKRPREVLNPFISILGVFAPHVAEELWQRLGHTEPLSLAAWPESQDDLVVEEHTTIVVQVNGKVRGKLELSRGLEKADVLELAVRAGSVQRYLAGMTVERQIYVPEKLVNLVVKGPE